TLGTAELVVLRMCERHVSWPRIPWRLRPFHCHGEGHRLRRSQFLRIMALGAATGRRRLVMADLAAARGDEGEAGTGSGGNMAGEAGECAVAGVGKRTGDLRGSIPRELLPDRGPQRYSPQGLGGIERLRGR